MLYEVLITACLIAHPGNCMQFDVPVKIYPSIKQCAKHGQLDVLHWLDRKPDWQIDKWTCTGSGETI